MRGEKKKFFEENQKQIKKNEEARDMDISTHILGKEKKTAQSRKRDKDEKYLK